VQRKWGYTLATIAAMAAALVISGPPGRASVSEGSAASGAPAGLTVYGQTLWNLEALLRDTFGNLQDPLGSPTVCLRLRDFAFVSATCGTLADYGYWKPIFVCARHSRFKLVRRAQTLDLGNVRVITVNGRYVSCGDFPVAFAPLAGEGSRTHRWLVVLHGWALTPFTCLGG
jgi:hypothetical protein